MDLNLTNSVINFSSKFTDIFDKLITPNNDDLTINNHINFLYPIFYDYIDTKDFYNYIIDKYHKKDKFVNKYLEYLITLLLKHHYNKFQKDRLISNLYQLINKNIEPRNRLSILRTNTRRKLTINYTTTDHISIESKKPRYIAEQLTLLQCSVFNRVYIYSFYDYINQNSKTDNSITKHFNIITNWVRRCILTIADNITRAKLINKFIKTSFILKEMQNYESMYQIIISLNHHVISRLKDTWVLVKNKKLFKKLNELMSYNKNFLNYRTLIKDKYDIIPCTSIIMKDLTFARDGNPRYNEDKSINIDRIKIIGNYLHQISKYLENMTSNKFMGFIADENFQYYIINYTIRDESEFLNTSLIYQPSDKTRYTISLELKNHYIKHLKNFNVNDLSVVLNRYKIPRNYIDILSLNEINGELFISAIENSEFKNKEKDIYISNVDIVNKFEGIYNKYKHYESKPNKLIYINQDIRFWSVQECLLWLDDINLGVYKGLFKFYKINGVKLLGLDYLQLCMMKIDNNQIEVGHRHKILHEIKKLYEKNPFKKVLLDWNCRDISTIFYHNDLEKYIKKVIKHKLNGIFITDLLENKVPDNEIKLLKFNNIISNIKEAFNSVNKLSNKLDFFK